MDTETVSPNFDDIRPLNNSEVKDAIEKLVANEDFERALGCGNPAALISRIQSSLFQPHSSMRG